MSNPFGENEAAGPATTEAETVVTTDEVDATEPDLDVDAGAGEDETETVVAAPPTKGTVAKKVSPTKKVSSRGVVAEGYITPVAAAKVLSEHLTTKARAAGEIGADEEIEVRPQVMYSYVKNNGPDSKNPLPRYTDAALTGGRECVVKADEVITWWDEKDARVAKRKVDAAEKAAKKAAAPAKAPVEAEAPTAPVAEAE